MSYQELRVIGYLISTFVGMGIFTRPLYRGYQDGSLDTSTIASSWGRIVLTAIAVTVVLSILTALIFTIVEAIKTRDEDLITEDERDKIIEQESTRILSNVSGAGFVLAMILLAVGQPILLVFSVIVYSFFIGGVIGWLVQLFRYRRGY